MVGDGENARTEARTDAQVDACISTPSMGLGPTGPRDQHLQSFSGIPPECGKYIRLARPAFFSLTLPSSCSGSRLVCRETWAGRLLEIL